MSCVFQSRSRDKLSLILQSKLLTVVNNLVIVFMHSALAAELMYPWTQPFEATLIDSMFCTQLSNWLDKILIKTKCSESDFEWFSQCKVWWFLQKSSSPQITLFGNLTIPKWMRQKQFLKKHFKNAEPTGKCNQWCPSKKWRRRLKEGFYGHDYSTTILIWSSSLEKISLFKDLLQKDDTLNIIAFSHYYSFRDS